MAAQRRWYAVLLEGRGQVLHLSGSEVARRFRGVKGVVIRPFPTREAAEAWLRGEGLEASGEFLLRAYTDGSVRGGVGSASAVLEAGGHGELFLPWCADVTEAEARALALAVLLAPRGALLVVQTDRRDFPPYFSPSAKGRASHPVLQGVMALAQALGVALQVEWVPRRRVEAAHQGARQGRENGEAHARKVEGIRCFLEPIPPRYRKAALDLLEAYPGEPGKEPLLAWLARGESTTRGLLRERLSAMGEGEVRGLLGVLRSLPPGWRKALADRDRERVWAETPPTEAQLRLLARLGYEGPPPPSLLEASREIARRLGRVP